MTVQPDGWGLRRSKPATPPTLLASAALAIGMAVASPASASTRQASSPLPSGASLVAAAKKAMLAARSVHFDLSSSGAGVEEHISADAGTATGRQVLTSGNARATVLLTKRDAYFGGDAAGLAKFFGMPTADVKKVGAKWVDVTSGSAQYTSFEKNLVASSLPAAFLPTVKSVAVGRVTVSGRPDYRLTWVATVSGKLFHESLDLAGTGPALPVSQVGTSGKDEESTTFSRWGEAIHVTAPKQTIAFSVLTG